MSENKTIKELIIDEFFSVSHAARKLGFTRRSIYKMMNENKVSVRGKNKIIEAGYCPKTFKPAAHSGNH